MLGLIPSLLIARALGPADFGVFATVGVLAGVAGVLADLGLSTTGVRWVAQAWPDLPDQAAARAWQFLRLRAQIASGFLLLSVPLSPLFSMLLPGNPPVVLVWLALVGMIVTNLSGSINAMLQATHCFRALALVLLANSGLTAVLALGLFFGNALNLITALVVLGVATSLASSVLGWYLLPFRRIERNAQLLLAERQALVRFGGWVWLANLLSMLANQLDVVLVGHWLPGIAVGHYSLASNLAAKAEVVNQSLHAVLLPDTARLRDSAAQRHYVRQALLRSAAISLLLLPLFMLASWVITLLYGVQFAAAVVIFQWLLAIALVDLWSMPLLLLAYPRDRPDLLAAGDALRVLILIGMAGVLLPVWGLAGMAIARLVGKIASVGWVLLRLRWWRS